MFTTALGKPLDARNVVRAFHAILKNAGLPDMRMHDLRHTCASLLLAQGAHPRFVMDLLGHSQISLTMDTYTTVMPALKKDVADRMEAILAEMEDDAGGRMRGRINAITEHPAP